MDSDKQKTKRVVKTAWKKGCPSPNPKGRPRRGMAIAEILRELGDIVHTDKTRLEIVLNKVYDLAETGYMPAIEFIADRTEGKAKQDIQLTQIKDQIEIE